MSVRPLSARALVLPAALVLATCARPPAPPRSIVLISLDTLRADHTGFLGYARDTTPHLDRLAVESVVFERALAPASWTLISHMSMLTGLYPNQHGVVGETWGLSHDVPTLAERLQRAGYRTIGLYFEGWIHARYGFDRGFDVFRAHKDADEAGAHLAEELAKLAPGQPFFLFLHLFDIHCGPLNEPGALYDCPPPYDRMFLADAPERLPPMPKGKLWKVPGGLDPRAVEGLTALYDGGIRYVDDHLGAWIDGWKREGRLANTLLLLTADHGEALAQRGPVGDHGGAYQEGLHVPLLVRLPDGSRAGTRVAAPVHLVDLVPTALEFAGLPADPALPGRSLLAPQPAERVLYALSPPSFEILWQWPKKYVELPRTETRTETFLQVDLEHDPGEGVGEPLTRAEFEQRRAAFLAGPAGALHPPLEIGAAEREALERLRALGYLGEDPAREDQGH